MPTSSISARGLNTPLCYGLVLPALQSYWIVSTPIWCHFTNTA